MSRDSLIGLSEKIEQASGPDQETDATIANTCFGLEVQRVSIGPDHRREEWVSVDRSGAAPISRPVSAFTESLDAALSLVPEGWRMAQLFERNCSLPNWIWKAELWNPEADETVRGIARNADLPALALCAAALRARAASTEQPS